MSELYHHGIKGQEHGVRNGPPYPLAPEDHTPEQIRQNPDIRREIKDQKTRLKAAKQTVRAARATSRAAKADMKIQLSNLRRDRTKEGIQAFKAAKAEMKAAKANLRVEKYKAQLEKSALKALKKGNDEKLRAKASTMSDEELNERIKRLNLERQYVSLEKDLNPAKKQRESMVKTMLGSALKNIGTQAVTAIAGEAWNKLVEQRDRPELKVNPKKGQKDK